MKMLSLLLISYRATAMRPLRKYKIILHITHLNKLNNFGHSLSKLFTIVCEHIQLCDLVIYIFRFTIRELQIYLKSL